MREFAGSNQNKFAKLTGIQQSQISQMAGLKREISDKMWAGTIESLGVEDQAISEDYEMLKQELEVSRSIVHQGKQLEEYLVRHGIKNVDAASKLGVSPSMVSIYKSSEQFRPDIADKINKTLAVNEDPVLYNTKSDRGNGLQHLPLITDDLRNLTDLSQCPRYEVLPKLEYDLKDGVVIRVETDSMEPSIRKGSELLGISVPATKYKYHTGLTAIHYADMVAIGEVQSNDILDKGYVTLHRGNGKILRVLSEDIQHLWHIAIGLNVKF